MTTSDGLRRDVAVILAAAGAGVRLGPGDPKGLRRVGDEPLLVHAVRRVVAVPAVGYLVVAAPPHLTDTVRDLVTAALLRGGGGAGTPAAPPEFGVVAGGGSRRDSVAAALASVPADFDIVLVHDAARALAPPSLVERVAAEVRKGHGAVIPVVPVTDTVVGTDAGGGYLAHLDRSGLRAVQTPQGFRRGVLVEAHATVADERLTDDAGLVARLGVRPHLVPGCDLAFKITTRHDLEVAAALVRAA
ncbi:MAG TPA: 2-C-methyl-D-erythritol 4-phosphate cytidylyltransferase [Natronosporangium sp.]|nr:2-C-methyl-D-erythritol 4-phosphate cytidylyltransferase [Natronosporangium sp.]